MNILSSRLPVIFCAIDTACPDRAMELANIASRAGCGIKLGLEFFNSNGPQGIAKITGKNPDTALFLDLKFHDIPNTVAGAVRAVTKLQPAYINIHISGCMDMMKAAREAALEEADRINIAPPKILGVTILTSLDDADLANMGYKSDVISQVPIMAKLAKSAAMDGVVCSAQEIRTVRETCGEDFVLMVPGIRLQDGAAQDQKRTMTPVKAIKEGATHLVIGRAITEANNPLAVVNSIMTDIEEYHEN